MTREFSCKKCGTRWTVWRQFREQIPSRPKCPNCGSRSSKWELMYNLPTSVHFKGAGWTPKSGTTGDLREVKGLSDELAKELD